MSTIRNNNTTGGGMYAPSQGINTALSNPNGITGVHQTNGAGGFSGNPEHFYTGSSSPFKPVPQGYTPYNPALGPTQQPLPAPVAPAPIQADMAVSNMPAAPGTPFGGAPNDPTLSGPQMGGEMGNSPEDNYKYMIASGCMPQEAAKHAINGTTPPGIPARPQLGGQPSLPPIPQSNGPINAVMSGPPPQTAAYGYPQGGGQYDTSNMPSVPRFAENPYNSGLVPPPAAPTGPQLQGEEGPYGVPSGPPPQTPAYGYGQQGGPIGNNLINSWNGGQQGRYGYGQGSNVSMLQALMGNGGRGYGDFLSQLLARYGQ